MRKAIKFEMWFKIALTDWGFNFLNLIWRIEDCSLCTIFVKILSKILLEQKDSTHGLSMIPSLGYKYAAFNNLHTLDKTAKRLLTIIIDVWWCKNFLKHGIHWNFKYLLLSNIVINSENTIFWNNSKRDNSKRVKFHSWGFFKGIDMFKCQKMPIEITSPNTVY